LKNPITRKKQRASGVAQGQAPVPQKKKKIFVTLNKILGNGAL
jgi:hypothetical protein